MHQADVTEVRSSFLRPDATRLRTAPPSYPACNRPQDAQVLLDQLIPGCPELYWRQRVYVLFINLMPKKLVSQVWVLTLGANPSPSSPGMPGE